jgi:hypothetical protein
MASGRRGHDGDVEPFGDPRSRQQRVEPLFLDEQDGGISVVGEYLRRCGTILAMRRLILVRHRRRSPGANARSTFLRWICRTATRALCVPIWRRPPKQVQPVGEPSGIEPRARSFAVGRLEVDASVRKDELPGIDHSEVGFSDWGLLRRERCNIKWPWRRLRDEGCDGEAAEPGLGIVGIDLKA